MEPNRVHKPHPKRFLKKTDCSHSLYGGILGLLVLMIAVITLSLFYGWDKKEEDSQEKQEQEVDIIKESSITNRDVFQPPSINTDIQV